LLHRHHEMASDRMKVSHMVQAHRHRAPDAMAGRALEPLQQQPRRSMTREHKKSGNPIVVKVHYARSAPCPIELA
jgi:hypothetical protein